MNSRERHEARRRRREEERKRRKEKRNRGHGFEEASSFGAIKKATKNAAKNVMWKPSVQRQTENILRNSYVLSHKVRTGKNIQKGFVKFYVNERGKTRFIQSVHISERCVQKALCDEALVPVIEKSLIFDNGASQKGKGTDFAARRLVSALRRYYRKYGNHGWIVLGDGHHYFESLRHEVIRDNYRAGFSDERVIGFAMEFVNAFDHGLGLGSQVCQISAVGYANRIDHYVTEVLRPFYYGRYMDDWAAICRTKEEAHLILTEVTRRYAEIGIEQNEKKVQIVKLSHGFTWLKDKYYLTDTGKVIRKPCRGNITKDRKKLKKMAAMLETGEISYADMRTFMGSTLGYLGRQKGRKRLSKNAHRTEREFIRLYNALVIDNWHGDWRNDEQNHISEHKGSRDRHRGRGTLCPPQRKDGHPVPVC